MESIPGYDDWKTTPPDDPEPASVCDCCGKYLFHRLVSEWSYKRL